MRYKLHTGFFAWLLHRLTGLALIFYIFVHLYVLSYIKDPEKFESLMHLSKHPLMKAAEAGLLFLIISHAFNGVRLTLIDIGVPTRYHKAVFWTAAGIGGLIALHGFWFLVLGGAH